MVHKTKKNVLLRRTLQDIGFEETGYDEGKIRYQFSNQLKNKELVMCLWYGVRENDYFYS